MDDHNGVREPASTLYSTADLLLGSLEQFSVDTPYLTTVLGYRRR